MRMDAQFRYIGGGRGVPGLPHILTWQEALRLGVDDALEAAVMNGKYEQVNPEPEPQEEPPRPKRRRRRSVSAETEPEEETESSEEA